MEEQLGKTDKGKDRMDGRMEQNELSTKREKGHQAMDSPFLLASWLFCLVYSSLRFFH